MKKTNFLLEIAFFVIKEQ